MLKRSLQLICLFQLGSSILTPAMADVASDAKADLVSANADLDSKLATYKSSETSANWAAVQKAQSIVADLTALTADAAAAAAPPAAAPPAAAPPAPVTPAAKASATAIITTTPNDKANYQGDRVTFPLTLNFPLLDNDGTVQTEVDNSVTPAVTRTLKACIPRAQGLVGYAPYTETDSNSKSQGAITGYIFRVRQEDRYHLTWKGIVRTPPDQNCPSARTVTATDIVRTATQGDVVQVSNNVLTSYPPNRYGWTYGALAIPFKMQLGGKKDIEGSATLGPYAGYKFDHEDLGFSVSTVAFLGPTNLNATKTVNGQQSTSTLFGISGGVGLLFVLKDTFQLGVVAGYDRTSSGGGYQYNNKPWLSFALGYAFSAN